MSLCTKAKIKWARVYIAGGAHMREPCSFLRNQLGNNFLWKNFFFHAHPSQYFVCWPLMSMSGSALYLLSLCLLLSLSASLLWLFPLLILNWGIYCIIVVSRAMFQDKANMQIWPFEVLWNITSAEQSHFSIKDKLQFKIFISTQSFCTTSWFLREKFVYPQSVVLVDLTHSH